MDRQTREEVLLLGRERSVVAIATAARRLRARVPVVLLNAGVIHRVGPHRLHVRLARALAEQGHPALRVDLSGIGDSRPLPYGMAFRESAVVDIGSALDQVTAGAPEPRAILFGLCSGADNALAAADADPRISGIVLVDPPAYATFRSRLRVWGPKLRSPAAWTRRIARALGGNARDGGRSDSGSVRQPPPPQVYRAQLRRLLDRGVRILAIHTSALGVRCNHPGQLFESFPELRGEVESLYYPNANHTFTELSEQASLISAVTGWCGRHFPGE